MPRMLRISAVSKFFSFILLTCIDTAAPHRHIRVIGCKAGAASLKTEDHMVYITERTFRDFRYYLRSVVNESDAAVDTAVVALTYAGCQFPDASPIEIADAARLLEYGFPSQAYWSQSIFWE